MAESIEMDRKGHTATADEASNGKNALSMPGRRADDHMWKFLLLGKGGVGKSALGNFLLNRRNRFQEHRGMECVFEAEMGEGELLNGQNIHVIDTPAFPDQQPGETHWRTVISDAAWLQGMAKVAQFAGCQTKGVDAILYVMSINTRFLQADKELMQRYFDEFKFWRYVILVFSHTTELPGKTEAEKKEYILSLIQQPDIPDALKWLVEKVNKRIVLVESVNWDQGYRMQKVREIHQFVLDQRNGAPYCNRLLERAYQCCSKAEDQILEAVKDEFMDRIFHGSPSQIKQQQNKMPDSTCFPGESTIATKEDGVKMMKHLHLGEKVLCLTQKNQAIYSKVIAFLHYEPNEDAEYLMIETKRTSVTMSANHLIFVATSPEPRAIFAGLVKPGDLVMCFSNVLKKPTLAAVTHVQAIRRRGIYAPLTSHGRILVDGVSTSCYASVGNPSIVHSAFIPLRLFHGLCKHHYSKRPKHGIHTYALLLYNVNRFLMNSIVC